MSRIFSRLFLACAAVLVLSAGLTACAPKLYKPDVVQGNFVSSEQVTALRAGMPKAQVRNILGTPLVTDVFHADRWDYVFTIMRNGVVSKPRRLTVYFNGETLARWEGDEMPSEVEFVSSIDSGRKIEKIPPLTASEKDLAAFEARENAKSKVPNAPTAAPSGAKTYPPLETP